MNKLTAKKVRGRLKPGMHNDGGGLYLRVSKTGAKSWILRCRVHGAKRDIGLGGAAIVSLAEARAKAVEMRTVARSGGDPLAERNRVRSTPTPIQRAWGVPGLCWALFCERLDPTGGFRHCERCGRPLHGHPNKRFCHREDDEECARRRKREQKQKERRR